METRVPQGETSRARRTQVEGKFASVARAQLVWPRGERKGHVRLHGSAEAGSGRQKGCRGAERRSLNPLRTVGSGL